MLKIDISWRAEKFLRALPVKQAKQIAKKMMALREQPQPQDSKKLQGAEYLRTDSGEYRIIYQFDHEIIEIVLVGKRNDDEVYRKLDRLS